MVQVRNDEMKLHDEIGGLAAAVGSMAADLKGKHDKLLAYAHSLQAIVADLSAAVARERNTLELRLAEEVIQWSAANDELRNQVAALSKRNREIVLCGKLNDALQISTTESEAYSVVSETAAQLFPEDAGATYLLSASRDVLEARAVWGTAASVTRIFSPNDCWAYRRGQAHAFPDDERRCPHLTGDRRISVCVPLLAQGEILGVLHLSDGPAGDGRTDAASMAEKRKLAQAFAENIGLGIGNLKLRESMRNNAFRDPLTGLFNRRYMEEALAQERHRSARNTTQLAVIMIDIDHFKQYNDDFGHDGGDAVLRELGTLFRKHVRGSDIACRYGGEEFLLILSPSTAEGAHQRAEKIRKAAARLRVHHADRDLGAITLSLGVAIFPDHGSEVSAIVKAADVTLYQAKSDGRNRVVMCAQGTERTEPQPLRSAAAGIAAVRESAPEARRAR